MMNQTKTSTSPTVRSIFISDLHLGNRFSKAPEALEFLKRHKPENLYLVGDFIDAWALRRRWHWPQPYDALLNHIASLVDDGTKLFYTPGNHDSFLRGYLVDEPPVRIQDQFVHRCADGRKMVIMHGDQFDRVEGRAQWLSVIGSVLYDGVLYADRAINGVLVSFGLSPRRISGTMKATVKKTVQFISGFEGRVVDHARQARCDGIICGHIHVPRYRMLDEILYINLGDWIENATALVEYGDGRLELLETSNSREKRTVPRKNNVNVEQEFEGLSPMAVRLSHQFLEFVLQDPEAESLLAMRSQKVVA